MSTQVLWLIEQHILQVNIDGILRGYASDQLSQELMSYVGQYTKTSRMHVMIDVSEMQASHINAELLYNALTPLLFEHQVRWIILYGANDELSNMFKEIMSDLFRNPCLLLDDYDTALSFLHRKDKRLYEMFEIAS